MGDCCVIGFQRGGEINETYSHWGSHPSRLGKQISMFLSKMTPEQHSIFKKHADNIRWVSLKEKASAAEIEKYKRFSRPDVSASKLSE